MLVAGAGSALLAPGGATPMFTALNFKLRPPLKRTAQLPKTLNAVLIASQRDSAPLPACVSDGSFSHLHSSVGCGRGEIASRFAMVRPRARGARVSHRSLRGIPLHTMLEGSACEL